jgi:predicted DNA-binding transcriptional regulator AlpA
MTDAVLMERIEQLTSAVQVLSAAMGARLTRAQLCERLGIHRNTLSRRLSEPGFPLPGKDGKWLLSSVIEWERIQ